MQCRAITAKATQCTRSAVGSDCYCKTHVFGNKPPVTPRIEGWYSSSTMRVPTASDRARRKLIRDLRDADGLIQKRIRFLTLTEYFLKYPEQATQLNVEACLKAMRDAQGEGTHLAYYREYFARKLSHKHKQKAQQKYAESIIRESDLGQDIAGVIASFL